MHRCAVVRTSRDRMNGQIKITPVARSSIKRMGTKERLQERCCVSELEARGLPLGMERPLESRNGWRRLRSLSSVSESGLLLACLSHVQDAAIQVEPSRSRPTPTSSDTPHTTSARNTSHRGAPKPPERQHRLARQL